VVTPDKINGSVCFVPVPKNAARVVEGKTAGTRHRTPPVSLRDVFFFLKELELDLLVGVQR
jgi:hypothetical protein